MKRIDEKVAISGDGAELIQSYLNELNMKLLAVGITESYSIVMEAETLFISAINELNQTTKVTIYEVQKIIEKHGTPDEIVKRYKQTSEALLDEEFYSMDPKSRELVKRPSTLNSDIKKLKEIIFHTLGLLTLILPTILLTLALIQLNQYEDDFTVFLIILEMVDMTDGQTIAFLIVGSILFLVGEIVTGIQGKLVISLRNTIRIRTFNRSILFIGAFASLSIKLLPRINAYNAKIRNYENVFDAPYTENILTIWIVLFIITELLILTRDHISSLYPLQPRFTPFEYYLKIHYILLFVSVTLFLAYVNNQSIVILIIAMILIGISTITTISDKYHPGPKFYFTLQIIPMLAVMNTSIARNFIYGEAILIFLVIYMKYRNEIKLKTEHILKSVS